MGNGIEIYGRNAKVAALYPHVQQGEDTIAEANACLIAAAPELLEALKTANEFIMNMPTDSFVGFSKAANYDHQIILAALAKAEGK